MAQSGESMRMSLTTSLTAPAEMPGLISSDT